ncbi:SDR family NAD(P)-dependent oxidoreductase [Alteromonas sediminis]|uniref:SDR family NAD(P)-dependent oxidoreductase n=1 Tax=Alteromonas sediminis TaxID=2259342 RepID=A0A3N5YKT1_9ALTE|nr:SDR family NAD(P)-dependent oxidoreductase [Alteromonas sediminis]RPJ65571.1 SDR family NAD(P)-dependent oxidoreductase [Alteromonas sediminis]
MTLRLLITGATSGIGETLALRAADEGYQVIACGRNEDKLAQLAHHENISTLQFDVTNESQTHTALGNVECDIAVLNAGTCEYVDIDAFEPDMFRRVFEPNFFGVVNATSALLSNLKPGNQVLIVDSLARLLPFSKSQAYGASKAALFYYTKSLEVDLHSKGIIVQSVSPGFVKTPLTDKNDFDMPMLISVEEAAKDILRGIKSKNRSVYFPTRFSLMLRFLGLLPAGLQKKISLFMKNKSEGSQ